MKLFVIDCESVGLHGETFWVGWVLVNVETGEELGAQSVWCAPDDAEGTDEGRDWVEQNIPSSDEPYICCSTRGLRSEFWDSWQFAKNAGALMFADCGWPVEARFLAACVDDNPGGRSWEGPYPLHDAASVFLAYGIDPLATNERLPNELPEHNPVNDARQTARLLVKCLQEHGIR